MIPSPIHNVHRFFLFTFILLCASVFVSPAQAQAAYTEIFPTINADGTVGMPPGWCPHFSWHGVREYTTEPVDQASGTVISGGTSYDQVCYLTMEQGNPYTVNMDAGGTTGTPYFSSGGANTDGTYWGAITFGGSAYSGSFADSEEVYYWKAVRSGGVWSAGGGGDSCDSGDTRICGFTPENGDVITGPNVDFTLDYYVNGEDIGGFVDSVSDVVVKLHNIDQNVLLLGFLTQSDIVLYNEIATTSGSFHFATTTVLADGNYRLEASIKRKFFFNWITVPGAQLNQTISKQFIVGASTFIGNLSQNGFNILNGTLASSTATSSIALVANCNPLGTFDMTNCLAGLFIPDAGQVQTTIQGAKDGILTRMPWGYITRFMTIVSSSATTTLPSFTTTIAQNDEDDTTTLTFNPGDMMAGGGALLDSIEDPYNGMTVKDIFRPIIQLSVALMVILTIAADISSSHNHASGPADVASRRRRT